MSNAVRTALEQQSLRLAVAHLPDALGLVLGGSAARGTAMTGSDLGGSPSCSSTRPPASSAAD